MENQNQADAPTGLLGALWARFGSCDYSCYGDANTAAAAAKAAAVADAKVDSPTLDGATAVAPIAKPTAVGGASRDSFDPERVLAELEAAWGMSAAGEPLSVEATPGRGSCGTAAPNGEGEVLCP